MQTELSIATQLCATLSQAAIVCAARLLYLKFASTLTFSLQSCFSLSRARGCLSHLPSSLNRSADAPADREKSVELAIRLCEQAAVKRNVSAPQVIKALSTIEKAKLPVRLLSISPSAARLLDEGYVTHRHANRELA